MDPVGSHLRDPLGDLLWMSNAVVMTGPHWRRDNGPVSLELSDELVSLQLATATDGVGLMILPDGPMVTPQFLGAPAPPGLLDGTMPSFISMGVHDACSGIAIRMMKGSLKPRIRSLGALWMTLERRCTSTFESVPKEYKAFLPWIPEKQRNDLGQVTLGLSAYFLPMEYFYKNPPPIGPVRQLRMQ